jgi:hypothetical protein
LIITADLIETHLLKDLPLSAYTILRSETRNGPLTQIVPSNPCAAELSLWVTDDNGYCDFAFGRAFFGELEIDCGDWLLEVADAVIQGCLVEKVWTLWSDRLYSKSVVQTKHSGQIVARNGIPFVYPPWLRTVYIYEPFIV